MSLDAGDVDDGLEPGDREAAMRFYAVRVANLAPEDAVRRIIADEEEARGESCPASALRGAAALYRSYAEEFERLANERDI